MTISELVVTCYGFSSFFILDAMVLYLHHRILKCDYSNITKKKKCDYSSWTRFFL